MPGVLVYLTFTLIYGGIITHSFITCKLHLSSLAKSPKQCCKLFLKSPEIIRYLQLASPENTIMFFDCRPKILHKHCLQFLLGVKMVPRETENNAYAKFWGDKQRTLWYVMVFWSGQFIQTLQPLPYELFFQNSSIMPL